MESSYPMSYNLAKSVKIGVNYVLYTLRYKNSVTKIPLRKSPVPKSPYENPLTKIPCTKIPLRSSPISSQGPIVIMYY